MTKFSILSLTIIIFVLSLFYGKSLTKTDLVDTSDKSENVITAIKGVNKVLKEDGVLNFDKQEAKKLTENEKSKQNLGTIKKLKRYKDLAEIAGIGSVDNPIIETIIGLENPQEIDHYTMEDINNKLQAYTLQFPEEAFGEIKNILNSQIAKKDPAMRGNLFVAASFIEGKEEQVKEITMREMENNILPKEKKENPIGGNKKPLENLEGAEEMAVVLAYNAYLAASHKDVREVVSDTIDIIKKQPNESLRRQIALTYDRAFPSHRADMLKKLKEEGIQLFPKDFVFHEEG